MDRVPSRLRTALFIVLLAGLSLVHRSIVVPGHAEAGPAPTPTSASPKAPSASPGPPSPQAPAPTPVPVPTFALGTVTSIATQPKACPTGSVCAGFNVVCPGVTEPRIAFTATRMPLGSPRGMVVFFAGDFGQDWWAGEEPGSTAFLGRLQAQGFVTVQVRWETGWSIAAPGEDAGTGHLACRASSMIRWIHDHRYVPLHVPAGPIGQCGFCITGNSAGASQVSYALSFYGLDVILDGVFPTSGPPQAAQDKGCLRRQGENGYAYGSNAPVIDQAHGFLTTAGPCERADPTFLSRWLAESVDTGGRDFIHPETRVSFIHSDNDFPTVPHVLDYIARLRAAGTPFLTEKVVPGMPHRIQTSAAGLEALFRGILGSTTG